MKNIKSLTPMCYFCGCKHDSKLELERCLDLHESEKRGEVRNLRTQVKYELLPPIKYKDQPDERAVTYRADFVYETYKDGRYVTVVEDTKSSYTRTLPDYILKRKLFKAKYCRDGSMFFAEVLDPKSK